MLSRACKQRENSVVIGREFEELKWNVKFEVEIAELEESAVRWITSIDVVSSVKTLGTVSSLFDQEWECACFLYF